MANLRSAGPTRRISRLVARLLGVPVATVVMWALRFSERRAGIVLIYHSVALRGGDPGRELVPPHSAPLFAAQVRHLSRHYRVVNAAHLREHAVRRRRGERFPAAITFDDDLACHATLAQPILRQESVTATFFLSGASLDRPFAFWYERLQRAFDQGVPEIPAIVLGEGSTAPSSIHGLGLAIERMSPEERRGVAERLGEAIGPDPPDSGLRADRVRCLTQAGMTVGFHTLRHDSLAWLEDGSLEASLVEGRDALTAAAGAPLTTIGYPHGRGDARVAAAARRAGFEAGFTTQPVAITAATDPLLQGRLGPSLRSVGAMAVLLVWALLRAETDRSTEVRQPSAS